MSNWRNQMITSHTYQGVNFETSEIASRVLEELTDQEFFAIMNIASSNIYFKDTIFNLIYLLLTKNKLEQFGEDVIIGISTLGGETVFDRYYVEHYTVLIRSNLSGIGSPLVVSAFQNLTDRELYTFFKYFYIYDYDTSLQNNFLGDIVKAGRLIDFINDKLLYKTTAEITTEYLRVNM